MYKALLEFEVGFIQHVAALASLKPSKNVQRPSADSFPCCSSWKLLSRGEGGLGLDPLGFGQWERGQMQIVGWSDLC